MKVVEDDPLVAAQIVYLLVRGCGLEEAEELGIGDRQDGRIEDRGVETAEPDTPLGPALRNGPESPWFRGVQRIHDVRQERARACSAANARVGPDPHRIGREGRPPVGPLVGEPHGAKGTRGGLLRAAIPEDAERLVEQGLVSKDGHPHGHGGDGHTPGRIGVAHEGDVRPALVGSEVARQLDAAPRDAVASVLEDAHRAGHHELGQPLVHQPERRFDDDGDVEVPDHPEQSRRARVGAGPEERERGNAHRGATLSLPRALAGGVTARPPPLGLLVRSRPCQARSCPPVASPPRPPRTARSDEKPGQAALLDFRRIDAAHPPAGCSRIPSVVRV